MEPLSELIVAGQPLQDAKRRSAALHAWVVRSETISRCTAFLAKHTNEAKYNFVKSLLSLLQKNGPPKPNSVLEALKGTVILDLGKSLIKVFQLTIQDNFPYLVATCWYPKLGTNFG